MSWARSMIAIASEALRSLIARRSRIFSLIVLLLLDFNYAASHPDRAPGAGLGDIKFDKAKAMPEADGAHVLPVHANMQAADPARGRHGEPGRKHARAGPASLKARQQVHMKMRRIGLDDGSRYRLRMVDHEDAPLIVGPFGHVCLIRRGILPAQLRPPLSFEPSLPAGSIGGADDETCHTGLVLCHEAKLRLQVRIGRGIDVTHQLPVTVEQGCIAARQTRRQRNRIERIDVARLKRANVHHRESGPVTSAFL